MDYFDFLREKEQLGGDHGFNATFYPDRSFDFQSELIRWSVQKGRAAEFCDCGMGKSLMQLAWAENVVRHTNKNVLILTPLAVSPQTMREGEKFGVEVKRSTDGTAHKGITVTNYEHLHKFNWQDFAGCVCDESGILKSFDGTRKQEITDFMRKLPYRLLATATPSPNDYVELGTSSEALGYLGYMDMLSRFFKNDQNNCATRRMYGEATKWRFKGHAEKPFWRWVCSWARAVRRPSDLGFDDGDFILPPLTESEHMVDTDKVPEGMLFSLPATRLPEQREERKRTIEDRCGYVADLVNHDRPALIWCHLNPEGDLLEKIIPGAVQVSGSDKDEAKEEKLMAFADGQIEKLVTKPKIGAWGLNYQHCAHVVTFPSHSFEQYYQSVRRCWRFGQKSPVHVDIVLTKGEEKVLANLQRKKVQAETMFSSLVEHMSDELGIKKVNNFTKEEEIPSWLSIK